MYDELLKRLREAAISADSGYEISESLYSNIMRAADAIEKLQKAVLRLEEVSGILDELPMVDQRESPKEET